MKVDSSMRVQVKLMGMLRSAMPAGGVLEVAEAATVGDVLQQLGVELLAVQVVCVNGTLLHDRRATLSANDEVLVMPPVGGG